MGLSMPFTGIPFHPSGFCSGTLRGEGALQSCAVACSAPVVVPPANVLGHTRLEPFWGKALFSLWAVACSALVVEPHLFLLQQLLVTSLVAAAEISDGRIWVREMVVLIVPAGH